MKSSRKPLRDVSNKNSICNKKTKLLSSTLTMTSNTNCKKTKSVQDDAKNCSTVDSDALDRILLVQSNLSSLTRQIDELVVRAFKLETSGKEGREELESFADVLSQMLANLKPWVPRFQKALSSSCVKSETQNEQGNGAAVVSQEETDTVQSPEPTESELEVSPSPLVAWHASCTIERGRQLFLLTPLPRSKSSFSNLHHSSKPVHERVAHTNVGMPSRFAFPGVDNDNDNLLEGISVKQTPAKPANSVSTEIGIIQGQGFIAESKSSKMDCSMIVMTPRFKMSPPKSCVLLEPLTEKSDLEEKRTFKSTPYTAGMQNSSSGSEGSSSSGQLQENLALRYPELVGLKAIHDLDFRKKDARQSPGWFMSPLKTCVLMEPSDENFENIEAVDHEYPVTSNMVNQQLKQQSILVEFGDGFDTSKKPTQELFGTVDNTPMLKEPASAFRRGKQHPGENTLKKELWTKFEAASISNLSFDSLRIEDNSQKGFLARLEEASMNEPGLAGGS